MTTCTRCGVNCYMRGGALIADGGCSWCDGWTTTLRSACQCGRPSCEMCSPSRAETLIYERQPGETCSCTAYRSAGVAAACSRCQPPSNACCAGGRNGLPHADDCPLVRKSASRMDGGSSPSIAEAHRAAWEGEGATPPPPCVAVASGWRDCRDRNAATGRSDECGKCSLPTPAAKLGEALKHILKARDLAIAAGVSSVAPMATWLERAARDAEAIRDMRARDETKP